MTAAGLAFSVSGPEAATPPSLGEDIRKAVPGARGVELDAAHLANVEQPDAFNTAVLEFLTD